jgi:hypothetical protein
VQIDLDPARILSRSDILIGISLAVEQHDTFGSSSTLRQLPIVPVSPSFHPSGCTHVKSHVPALNVRQQSIVSWQSIGVSGRHWVRSGLDWIEFPLAQV